MTPNFGRARNELSLKEQNSRIDKLSKENFDLKLRIYFLEQNLENRSDEGVKDILAKNAQLATDTTKLKRDNAQLRKRVKELERDLRVREDGASAARTVSESEDMVSSRSFQNAQLEEELSYLRDRVTSVEVDNEQLRQGDANHQSEKQRMADQIKALASGHQPTLMIREELEREKSKRERADSELKQVRQELARLKAERSPFRGLMRSHASGLPTPPGQDSAQLNPMANSKDASDVSGTTVIEQIKQENEDLRRDLGAQTSMLTSRNRERERLQQQIEDLKIEQRRGEGSQTQAGTVSGDSILDRSVSRSHIRPSSHTGTSSHSEHLSESERDKYETKQAALRDENARLRLRVQDLQVELDTLTGSAEHLASLRQERDEALTLLEEERDYAADTIDRLEVQIEEHQGDIEQLLLRLKAKEEEGFAFEREIKDLSEEFKNIASHGETELSTRQRLEQGLQEARAELEILKGDLQEAEDAKERLEVQAESSQAEIAFLREEQEADKIKLSELQSALSRAKARMRDEKDRAQEFEELDEELRHAKEEARRFRKRLVEREDDLARYHDQHERVQTTLRRVTGTDVSDMDQLLHNVAKFGSELDSLRDETTELKDTFEKNKQRLVDQVQTLQGLRQDNEWLNSELEKTTRQRDKHATEIRRLKSVEADQHLLVEMENARKDDQQRMADLEEEYKTNIHRRNMLLFDLWERLAGLCGNQWLTKMSEEHEIPVPTVVSVGLDPNSITDPLTLALDHISRTYSSFRSRLRVTEKAMTKELDGLSQGLESRSKRIDALERNVSQGSAIPNVPVQESEELRRLEDENRTLRRKVKVLQANHFSLPGLPSPQLELDEAAQEAALMENERLRPGASRAVSSAGSHRSHRRRPEQGLKEDHSALQRHHSTATMTTDQEPNSLYKEFMRTDTAPSLAPNEQTLILRLKEADRRLRAERDARLLDRQEAHKRLEAREDQMGKMRRELEVEKNRSAFKEGRQEGSGGSGKGTEA